MIWSRFTTFSRKNPNYFLGFPVTFDFRSGRILLEILRQLHARLLFLLFFVAYKSQLSYYEWLNIVRTARWKMNATVWKIQKFCKNFVKSTFSRSNWFHAIFFKWWELEREYFFGFSTLWMCDKLHFQWAKLAIWRYKF